MYKWLGFALCSLSLVAVAHAAHPVTKVVNAQAPKRDSVRLIFRDQHNAADYVPTNPLKLELPNGAKVLADRADAEGWSRTLYLPPVIVYGKETKAGVVLLNKHERHEVRRMFAHRAKAANVHNRLAMRALAD